MNMVIFGLCAIACAFIVTTFLQLSYERVRQPKWWGDVYFWLVTGSFWVGAGLLWFSVVRAWQAMMLPIMPFVQSPLNAQVAATIILLGLSFKVRAISIGNSWITGWFLGLCAAWAGFSYVWSAS